MFLHDYSSILKKCITIDKGKNEVMHVARMGEKRNPYRILVGNPVGKRPLGRSRRRWVDNIKRNLRDRMGWYGLDRSGSG
jgi:hypothetical protein